MSLRYERHENHTWGLFCFVSFFPSLGHMSTSYPFKPHPVPPPPPPPTHNDPNNENLNTSHRTLTSFQQYKPKHKLDWIGYPKTYLRIWMLHVSIRISKSRNDVVEHERESIGLFVLKKWGNCKRAMELVYLCVYVFLHRVGLCLTFGLFGGGIFWGVFANKVEKVVLR